MLPYQQRAVKELTKLKDRVERLEKFVMSDKFDTLPKHEKILLRRQLTAMRDYAEALEERIKMFSWEGKDDPVAQHRRRFS